MPPEARVDIRGEHRPLQRIFSDDFFFQIPNYQRPYRWERQQCEELMTDLHSFASHDGSIDSLKPFFLGSIVLASGELQGSAAVIDGQQRLTTLTMLLASLRATTEGDVKLGLEQFLMQKGNIITGSQHRYRLRLRERDAQFFQSYVQEPDGIARLAELKKDLPETQARIRDNTLWLVDFLKTLTLEQRTRLAQFVIQRCYLVVVSTSDEDSAFRIFTILNDRGLDLSHADIIKSEIISRVDKASQEEATRRWEQAEEQLGHDEFKGLLGHLRMMKASGRTTTSILQDFRSMFIERHDGQKLVTEIAAHAELFDQVRRAHYEDSTADSDVVAKINRAFGWLNRVDNSNWVPVALKLARRKQSAQELLEGIRALERLTAYFHLRRANATVRIPRFARVLDAIQRGAATAPDSPLLLSSEEKRDFLSLIDGDLYLIQKARTFVLLRADELLGEGAASYHTETTVEHVLPQNPPARSRWSVDFPAEAREEWTHRLGNLVLLTRAKNSEASNYEFDVKKEKYFGNSKKVSTFALTTQVLREPVWTPSVVARRQRLLVGRLAEEWSLSS